MNLLAEQIIVNILKQELNLDNNAVFVANQNKKIPNDKNLYISVGMVDSQIISNTRGLEKDGLTDAKTVQQIQARENIQIDLFSADNNALIRRGEILMALNSIYSVQQQELNQFKIFQIPQGFVNTSSAEGGSQINRFTIIIACFVWYKKTNTLTGNDYYDNFDTRVDDEVSIGTDNGIIEFNISA